MWENLFMMLSVLMMVMNLFLVWPSEKTRKLWDKCKVLLKKENENWWILDIDTETISSITSHQAGYIDKELEIIFDCRLMLLSKGLLNLLGDIEWWKKLVKRMEGNLVKKLKKFL
jgi:pyruvate-formate lyase